ncbi:hypothetical protein CsatB_004708 [Cannabis sativa]
MAKLSLTLTLLFFFFTFSHARFSLDLTSSNDVVEEPESNHIFLPTQRPESDPNFLNTQTQKLVVSQLDESDPKLTFISFRPINGRQFPRRPFPLTFRHRHGHRCRHHQFRLRRSDPTVRSYGNDMILSDELSRDQSSEEDAVFRHHHHHRHLRHGHHHHINNNYHHNHEYEGNNDHGYSNGFMRSFRKFLNLD